MVGCRLFKYVMNHSTSLRHVSKGGIYHRCDASYRFFITKHPQASHHHHHHLYLNTVNVESRTVDNLHIQLVKFPSTGQKPGSKYSSKLQMLHLFPILDFLQRNSVFPLLFFSCVCNLCFSFNFVLTCILLLFIKCWQGRSQKKLMTEAMSMEDL